MKKTLTLIIPAVLLLAACGGDEATPTQLTFQGGTSFNPAHTGQTLRAALLDGATVLEIQKTTVQNADPSFSITFTPTIDRARAYVVRYWIDSNFASGASGANVCNGPTDDHQWSVDIPAGQTTFKDTHRPANTQDVCGTFTFALTFAADGTFNGPHANAPYRAALVRGMETTALDVVPGTVAAAGTSPALSVTFADPLVIGEPYSVKLWIDLNAGGGTAGACDAPPTDHQWSVDIPTALGSPSTFTYGPHNTTFTDVCSYVF